MMKMTNLFWQERIELSKLNESTNTVWMSVLYSKCFSPWPIIKDIYCYSQLTNHLYVKNKWLKVSLKYIPFMFCQKSFIRESFIFLSKTKKNNLVVELNMHGRDFFSPDSQISEIWNLKLSISMISILDSTRYWLLCGPASLHGYITL